MVCLYPIHFSRRLFTILTRHSRLDCMTFLIILFALLNSLLALRSDLKELWLLRIPLLIYQFDDQVFKGF